MFRKKLEEDLALLFGCPVFEDKEGQSELVNSVYYEISKVVVRPQPEESLCFDVSFILTRKFNLNDSFAFGFLTSKALKSGTKIELTSRQETQLEINQDYRKIAIEAMCTICIQHDQCREELKNIDVALT